MRIRTTFARQKRLRIKRRIIVTIIAVRCTIRAPKPEIARDTKSLVRVSYEHVKCDDTRRMSSTVRISNFERFSNETFVFPSEENRSTKNRFPANLGTGKRTLEGMGVRRRAEHVCVSSCRPYFTYAICIIGRRNCRVRTVVLHRSRACCSFNSTWTRCVSGFA